MKSAREIVAAGAALLLCGCFDFDRTFDPCFGDEEGCGFGGASSSGGAATDGGMNGSGGDSSGGADGSGGSSSGGMNGSGGDSSGGADGSGGSSSGGTNGTGGASGENPRPRVNEIFIASSGFIELYNAGTGAWDYEGFSVATGQPAPDYSRDCILRTGTLAPGGFLVIEPGSALCEPGQPFALSRTTPASTVYLFDPEGQIVDQRSHPDATSPTIPAISESWQATPDGGTLWKAGDPTRGVSNE